LTFLGFFRLGHGVYAGHARGGSGFRYTLLHRGKVVPRRGVRKYRKTYCCDGYFQKIHGKSSQIQHRRFNQDDHIILQHVNIVSKNFCDVAEFMLL
jgi:hypothetical protein